MKQIDLAYKLYLSSTLSEFWPIKIEELSEKLLSETEDIKVKSFVRDEKGVAIIKTKGDKCSLILIAVDKAFQRQGIGKSLLEGVKNDCIKAGVKTIYLGHKIGKYIWPGIPEQPDALRFFTKVGFIDYWGFPAEDLKMEIADYRPDNSIYQKIEKSSFKIVHPDKNDSKKLLQFEEINFPYWEKYFRNIIEKREYDKFLIVKDSGNEIVASEIISWGDYIFSGLFSGLVGSIGAVGVLEYERGKGIGMALYSKGMEILKRNDIKYAVVEYTSVPGFYEKLGFERWRKYQMLKLEL